MPMPTPSTQWLKWNDGETHELMITSHNPEQMRVHWTGSGYEPCVGPGCPWCMNGNKAKTRWSVDVICQDVELVWEMANLTYQDLQAIAQQYGGIHHLSLRVSRRGTGRQTRYTLIPLGTPTQEPQAGSPTPQPQAPAPQQGPTPQANGNLQEMMAYARDLCTVAGKQPKAELHRWLQTDGMEYADRKAKEQLPAWIAWLETQYNGHDEEPEPIAEQSLGDLL